MLNLSPPEIKVKICGVRTEAAARAVRDSHADAVGLNFYPESPRYLAEERIEAVTAELSFPPSRVGVFVNAKLAEIERMQQLARLDLIQLHGDEPLEMIADFPDYSVIRAVRCRGADIVELVATADEIARRDLKLAALLVDAREPGAYGGTGKTVDWRSLQGWRDWSQGTPLLLAGGLTPDNVGRAIEVVRPAGVDTASGVESGIGEKDPQLCRRFAECAAAALDGGAD